MIPYGKQDITDSDIESVVSVLKSDFLTQGPVVPKFENLLCEYQNFYHIFSLSRYYLSNLQSLVLSFTK